MSQWSVVGHEWAVRQMRLAVERDEVPHALLITGSERIGKMTLARTVAKAMLCKTSGDDRPCGHCSACKRMESGNYPDFMAIEPEDPARPSLKVDQIRALERFLYLTPNESSYKIAIVSPFEVATISAANALLKTLEEPPPYAHLILLASDTETLLPTIVSRTQQLALRPLERAKIQQALVERWHVPEQQAERLARLSGGRLGWAVQAATDATYLERMQLALQTLFELLDSDLPSRFDKAKALAKDTEQLVEFLEYWQAGWRDILLLQANASVDEEKVRGLVYREELQPLVRTARRIPVQASVQTLRRLKEAQTALYQNANTQLLVENLLLNLPSLT